MKRNVSSNQSNPKKQSLMAKSLRWAFEIAIILIVVIAIQAWMQRNMTSGKAPYIQETTLNGEELKLTDYTNKGPFIIHFWASWCPICQYEKDTINDIAQKWPLLSIATFENTNTPIPIMRYMKKNNISHWPTILDSNNTIASYYGVDALPSTYIVDKNGIIRFKSRGYTTKWGLTIRLWLTQLLYN